MQFSVILCDPAWAYRDVMKGHSFSLDHEYETQPQGTLESLPVKSIAAKDATLFMWAVSPQLPEAIALMKAWGFRYVTVAFVWSKKTARGKQVANLGRWTMGSTELCLLGVRGKPKRVARNVRQFVEAERTVHSRKPAEVRDRIVTLMGDVPRIELFAREEAPGWIALGNEIDGRDLSVSIPDIAGW